MTTAIETFAQYLEKTPMGFMVPTLEIANEGNSRVYSTRNKGFLSAYYYIDNSRLNGPAHEHLIDDAVYYFGYIERQCRAEYAGVSACIETLGINPTDIVLKFGGNLHEMETRHNSGAIRDYFHSMMNDKQYAIQEKIIGATDTETRQKLKKQDAALRYYRDFMSLAFGLFQFAPSKQNPELLGFYESFDKYNLERRTTAKPAKAIKRLIPFLSDDECSAFAAWFKDNCAAIEYKIAQSKTREGFNHAYSAPRARSNDYDGYRGGIEIKSLECSCMRHGADYWGQSIHPAESYASGDFKIIWAFDKGGRVGARVTVYIGNGKYIPAPIYSVCNNATDEIIETMVSEGWVADDCPRDWKGARLLKLEIRENYYAVSYNDMASSADDDGDYFVIQSGGKGGVQLSTTAGHTYSRSGFSCSCENCGEGLSEDDSCFDENSGETLCEDCHSERFITCANCHDSCPSDDSVTVQISRRHHREYCPDCANENSVECAVSGNMVSTDSVIYCESNDEYCADWLSSEHYFYSDISGEYFPIAEMVVLPNGDKLTRGELNETGHYIINETETETGETETQITLKPYLEYNSVGRVINRQTEFEFAA